MFDYARKIREYRERKFISQGELAKILKVSNVSVCCWETGKFEPNMETKNKLVALSDLTKNEEEGTLYQLIHRLEKFLLKK